jgi:uncharacterized membrane protein YdbT with pleckstrin-like domain
MNSNEIFGFLHEHFLFKYLTDDELGQILPLFTPITLDEGEVLFRSGFPGRNFFIIVSGQVTLVDDQRNQRAITSAGHFGEISLIKDQVREETALASENTVILAVNKRSFLAIISAYPTIKSRLSAMRSSDQILDRFEFPWIVENEHVRYIDRKHINVLYSQLLFPLLFLIATGIGAILLDLNLLIFFPIIFILSGLWSIWLWLDWRNDFYLVTNNRAAWVEKVIWLHDQRREVPLQSILSVNISTNQLQRVFGYGDVIIRTYTGNIPMRNTTHPEVLVDLINEARERALEKANLVDKENINQAIRSRLNLEDEPSPLNLDKDPDYTDLDIDGGAQLTETITPLQEFLNLFRARYELNGVINYRKHVFILLKNSWWLWVLFIMSLIAFFARMVQLITSPSLTMLGVILLLPLSGLAYTFADWANDRFQITDKQVIDLDRKPFGRETKRSALLENILSLDYRRENIIQRFFDFGTVAINVGDIQLDFEYVAHPVTVQNEIFERYNNVIKQKEDLDAQRRRDDMVEFLAAYHQESTGDSLLPDEEDPDV